MENMKIKSVTTNWFYTVTDGEACDIYSVGHTKYPNKKIIKRGIYINEWLL